MDHYNIYSKIEKHINFGIRLFLIDKKGKHILTEINMKKFQMINKNGKPILSNDMKKISKSLISILNVKKFTPRLYLSLIYFLDELLFKDIEEYNNKFYIDENEAHSQFIKRDKNDLFSFIQ